MNSATIPSPRSVRSSFPSTKTGATGASNVPGQADPDVRVLGLAGPVDDAAHDGDLQVLDARVRLAPARASGP